MTRTWLPLDLVSALIPEMCARGIAQKERSPSGFTSTYRRALGQPDRLTQPLREARSAVIKECVGAVLWVRMADGRVRPSDTHLRLAAYAYSPDKTRLQRYADQQARKAKKVRPRRRP